MQVRKNLFAILNWSVFVLILVLLACVAGDRKYKSPPHYALNKPYKIKLPAELKEISGITYYARDNSLFFESDEKGCLYKMALSNINNITKWKFSHKKDYEDIVLVDSTFYILNSNGDITTINFQANSPIATQYDFSGEGDNEFESLYYDSRSDKLVILCKDCENDNHNVISSYSFDRLQHTFSSYSSINTKSLFESSPKSAKIKPSAAAVNPLTGELYIISSIARMLIVADSGGHIKDTYNLNPRIFNHPEGITFTPGGDLFITNEAERFTPATILFFKIQK